MHTLSLRVVLFFQLRNISRTHGVGREASFQIRVEPPNKGHSGEQYKLSCFVLYREVVLSSEVLDVCIETIGNGSSWDHEQCPL